MNEPLLVLDVHYLAHRAFHTQGDLSWKGKATGVIFGILKSLSFLKDDFQTDSIAFCFEDKRSLRREIYPPYKRKRRTTERTPEETESYEELMVQISELRHRYLPTIGFKNIFSYRGFESDDIMARFAEQATDYREVILVTADNDLLQCLTENVSIYSPTLRKLHTKSWFVKTYGIQPSKWAVVKAIAGCKSDEVEGVKGIGETTALKYLRGELKEDSKAYQTIRSEESRAIVLRNRKLVKLPFEGCPVPVLKEDAIDRKGWQDICGVLGMKSLAHQPPVLSQRMFRYVK